ncbi:urea carboxylase-associated family protein [Amycolatopsis japonica]
MRRDRPVQPAERLWTSRTRQLQGTHVTRYDRLWSTLPYLRPLLTFTNDTLEWYGADDDGGRVHDLLGARCDPYVNHILSGKDFDFHCHSNLTRAVLPYGLTEFDVHDVLNIFTVTGINDQGDYFMKPHPPKRPSRPGHKPPRTTTRASDRHALSCVQQPRARRARARQHRQAEPTLRPCSSPVRHRKGPDAARARARQRRDTHPSGLVPDEQNHARPHRQFRTASRRSRRVGCPLRLQPPRFRRRSAPYAAAAERRWSPSLFSNEET